MFTALRHRDYRLYWIGAVISFIGSWTQSVSYQWLVYEITGSKLWLGIVGFAGSLPLFALTLFGGALADRVNKRKTLIVTQSFFVVFAFILGLLVQRGVIAKNFEPAKYIVTIIAVMQGIVLSLDQPLRQMMPATLVPKEDLVNAVMLNSSAFNGARIIGPMLAGYLIARFGMASCFYVNSASFLAVILALALMHKETPAAKAKNKSLVEDTIEGMRYILNHSQIKKLMLAVGVSALFVMPYATLMPVFAKDILHSGVKGNAALLTSVGIGALAGTLTLAGASKHEGRGKMLVLASAVGGILMILFANSENFLLSRLLLIGLGFAIVSFNQTANSLIQLASDDRFRGRVVSGYAFIFLGLAPFANLQAGGLAEALGAPATVTLWGLVFFATSVFLLSQKDMMAVKPPDHEAEIEITSQKDLRLS